MRTTNRFQKAQYDALNRKRANVLHKTSKGMREMNYQDTQRFERAKMLQLPIQPLLVLCGVSHSLFLI